MAEAIVSTAPAAEDAATAAVAALAISEGAENKSESKSESKSERAGQAVTGTSEETVDAAAPPGELAASSVVPPHRSHDPAHNQKRTDPFMFGQRFLTAEDDVFEYNAWDHVETDDAFKEYAEKQYALQRSAPVSDFDKSRFNADPAKWWNLFYKNNTANFFKDRKWLQQEFPVLDRVCQPDAGPATILEIGAGAGNTAFPILARNRNPQLRIHACDFSKTAVDVMRADAAYDSRFMQADVWDVAATGDDQALPPGLGPASVDVAILVFIFSALSPSQWRQAVANVARVVKPGGTVCFRDYGRGDLAQVRFRRGRYLDENFYIRGDGTRVYFFDQDELVDIWTRAPAGGDAAAAAAATEAPSGAADGASDQNAGEALFELENMGVDRRLIVNRAMKLKMYRCWLQGRFRRK
ncbi:actin-binding protein [Niveomyces insectorum RCEF 264]|uniref:tRNA N(3)-methylcytidine methyltransferase n=1 Tax=Niveomyces insectorum RCEF 264 TaxID=1081102 RepID=A0A167X4F6_9HYPO|nr:actin-binding protein [Niveomyces insectorum RCEF 264]